MGGVGAAKIVGVEIIWLCWVTVEGSTQAAAVFLGEGLNGAALGVRKSCALVEATLEAGVDGPVKRLRFG